MITKIDNKKIFVAVSINDFFSLACSFVFAYDGTDFLQATEQKEAEVYNISNYFSNNDSFSEDLVIIDSKFKIFKLDINPVDSDPECKEFNIDLIFEDEFLEEEKNKLFNKIKTDIEETYKNGGKDINLLHFSIKESEKQELSLEDINSFLTTTLGVRITDDFKIEKIQKAVSIENQ